MTVRRTACKQERVRETLPVQRSVQPTKVWERPVMFPERERAASLLRLSCNRRKSKHDSAYTSPVKSMRKSLYGEKYMEQIENAKKVRL